MKKAKVKNKKTRAYLLCAAQGISVGSRTGHGTLDLSPLFSSVRQFHPANGSRIGDVKMPHELGEIGLGVSKMKRKRLPECLRFEGRFLHAPTRILW